MLNPTQIILFQYLQLTTSEKHFKSPYVPANTSVRLPNVHRIGVETHQVELVTLLEVDPDSGSESAGQAGHEIKGVKDGRVGVDHLVHEQLGLGGFDPGSE